jgi:pimeloyl-ACP methyl ester carboxylesterase
MAVAGRPEDSCGGRLARCDCTRHGIDPRGFGRSDRPRDPDGFRLAEYARDVLAVADALGLERFACHGHSAGGSVGLTLAVTTPERVGALVVASQWPDAEVEESRSFAAGFADACRAAGWRGVIGAQLESEGVTGPHWVLDEIDPDAEALAQRIERCCEISALDLSAITAPTRFVIGELEDPDRDAERAAARIRGADVVYLPGRGHLTAFLDVEQTLRHALPILAGSPSPA